MEIDPTYLIVDQKECKRLHKEGMSTRRLAEHFKVPLRQIQNALDLEKRKKWDRDWSKTKIKRKRDRERIRKKLVDGYGRAFNL